MQLIELDCLKYSLCIDNSCKSPLSDYYMNRGGRAFALFENGKLLTYAIINDKKKGLIALEHLFIPEEQRDTEYPSLLIRAIRYRFPLPMQAVFIESLENFGTVKQCLEACGFKSCVVCKEFRMDITEENIAKYREKHFEKAAEYLRGKGFVCLPFSRMGEDTEAQLKHSFTNEFQNTFEVLPFFEGGSHAIDRERSMALTKDGKLRAYVLVTAVTKDSIRIEQAAEARNDIGSGIIVYPLLAFNEATIRDKALKKVYYAISSENERSLTLVESLSGYIDKTSANVIRFVLT